MTAIQETAGLEPAQTELFARSTEEILGRLNIGIAASILDFDAPRIANEGFSHVITDSDGVLNAYGDIPDADMIAHLGEIASGLKNGVSIVTNNRRLNIDGLPDNVRLFAPGSLVEFKPSPRLINDALVAAGTEAEATVGFGDGLTDMAAYKAAHLGGLCLVKSCGPHPVQGFVHRAVYKPLSSVASLLI